MATDPTAAAGGSGKVDAADEAGGEAVYSSDGLPPLPIPKVPTGLVVAPGGGSGEENVLDDGGGVDASTAYSTFAAKDSSAPSKPDEADDEEGSSSPLNRLERLSREVARLEKELSGSDSEEEELQVAGREWALSATRQLQGRLEAARLQVYGGSTPVAWFQGRQEGLSQLIAHSASAAAKQEDGDAAPSASEEEQQQVVYELFGGAPKMESTTSTSLSSGFEERVVRLERLLGSATTSASSSANASSKTVLQRLEDAESASARITDEKTLTTAASRSKVIRADLEAASKARSKLSTALSVSSEDAKTIASLHSTLLELEGVSTHLPAILTRIQQLSHLHTAAADFSSRLGAVETAAADTELLLKGVEKALQKAEEGFTENAGVISASVAGLDEKLQGLP